MFVWTVGAVQLVIGRLTHQPVELEQLVGGRGGAGGGVGGRGRPVGADGGVERPQLAPEQPGFVSSFQRCRRGRHSAFKHHTTIKNRKRPKTHF